MLLQSQGKVEEWEDRAPPMKGKGHLTRHWWLLCHGGFGGGRTSEEKVLEHRSKSCLYINPLGSNFSELATSEVGSSTVGGWISQIHATKCLEALRKCCYLRAKGATLPTRENGSPVILSSPLSRTCRKGKRQRDEGKGQRPGPVAFFEVQC